MQIIADCQLACQQLEAMTRSGRAESCRLGISVSVIHQGVLVDNDEYLYHCSLSSRIWDRMLLVDDLM